MGCPGRYRLCVQHSVDQRVDLGFAVVAPVPDRVPLHHAACNEHFFVGTLTFHDIVLESHRFHREHGLICQLRISFKCRRQALVRPAKPRLEEGNDRCFFIVDPAIVCQSLLAGLIDTLLEGFDLREYLADIVRLMTFPPFFFATLQC